MTFADIIGSLGVALLLLAYLLDLTNRLPNGTPASLTINSVGAGLASTSASLIHFWPFVIPEGTWALVSVVGLVRWMVSPDRRLG